jgi:TPR repeat protein
MASFSTGPHLTVNATLSQEDTEFIRQVRETNDPENIALCDRWLAGDIQSIAELGHRCFFRTIRDFSVLYCQLAEKCYKKAVDAGNPLAMARLGSLCECGQCSDGGNREENMRRAISLYRTADNAGCAEGTVRLGHATYEENPTGAVALYEKAAKQGNGAGLAYLGLAHEFGWRPFTVDCGEALHCYKMAAEKGSSLAAFRLWAMYNKGKGTTIKDPLKDPLTAHKFCVLCRSLMPTDPFPF